MENNYHQAFNSLKNFEKLLRNVEDASKLFLIISCHYEALLNFKIIPDRRKGIMASSMLYCILAPKDKEQNNMMLKLLKNKICDEVPIEKEILNLFLSRDLIIWSSFCDTFADIILSCSFFNPKETFGEYCWKILRCRVVEHNIIIIASFYGEMNLSRMSKLLSINNQKTEEFLISMTGSGTIQAKIDLTNEMITFTTSVNADEMLNKWPNDLQSTINFIKKTKHLIDSADKF